jgi:hypothetical protein
MKTFIYYLLFVISPSLLFSQVTFNKTFTITGDDDGISVIQTRDGNYLVYCLSGSIINNCILIKTGANGDSIWCKLYPGHLSPWIINNHEPIIETGDSGYLFTTVFLDTTFLIRTNKNGDTLWTVKYMQLRYATFQQTIDGGYVICGFDTTNKICMIKTNNFGQEQWKKWISWEFPANAMYMEIPSELSIKQTTDGGFIVSGNTHHLVFNPPLPNLYRIFLIRTNSSGDTLWTKKIHNMPLQKLNTVQATSGNGFIGAGTLDSSDAYNNIHMNGFVMKFDENGDTLWTKSYGGTGNQEFNSFEKTDDGGFIACGYNNPDFSQINPYTFAGFYLVRMDASGDTLWTKYYPGGQAGGHDILGYSVHQTSDHGFIACGVQYDSLYNGHVFLIKTDALGNVYPQGIDDKQPSAFLSLFPNPTRGMVYLNPPGKYNTFEISDLLGKVILWKDIDPDNNSTLMIDLSGNPGGIYIIRLKNDQGMAAGKIVLE